MQVARSAPIFSPPRRAAAGVQTAITVALILSFSSLRDRLGSIEGAQAISSWEAQVEWLLVAHIALGPVVLAVRRIPGLVLYWAVRLVLVVLLIHPAAVDPLVLVFVVAGFGAECCIWIRFPLDLLLPGFAIATVLVPWNEFTRSALTTGRTVLAGYSLAFGLVVAILMAAAGVKMMERERRRARDLVDKLERDVQLLTRANIGFQEYVMWIEQKTLQDERDRISREVHDTTGYMFTTIRMTFEAVKGLIGRDPAAVDGVLDQGIALCREGIHETRAAVRQLRRKGADEQRGLAYLTKIARNFENATHMSIVLDFTNCRSSYGAPINQAVHRMVQEGLTNSFRHGKANRVSVVLMEVRDQLHVMIDDDGTGARHVDRDVGLAGMDERIRDLGGTLYVFPDQPGFSLRAEIPVIA